MELKDKNRAKHQKGGKELKRKKNKKEKKSREDDNNMKWSSIPLTIDFLYNLENENLNEFIFEKQFHATIKLDGTNVGRD